MPVLLPGNADLQAHSTQLEEFPVQVYQRLETMATVIPAAGQQDGSYLTGFSSAGLQ